jgi:acetyltransferase
MRTFDVATVPAATADQRSLVRIRAIRATDASELQRFYAALAPETRQTRFLSVGGGVNQALSRAFCTTDHDHREGFIAITDGRSHRPGRIVGHLCLEPDGADAAEVAIAVADEFQRRGIGRRLMAAGVVWARKNPVTRLTATMFAGNAPIHWLLEGLGLPSRTRYVGAGVAEITIDMVARSAAA